MESSLDVIRTQIEKAQPVLEALDAKIEAIEFDPLSAPSVAAATLKVDEVINDLLAPFKANPILGPLAADLKTHYLDSIRAQVLEAKEQSSARS